MALTVCASGSPIGAADAAQVRTRPVGTLPALRYRQCGSAGDSRSGTWDVFRSGTLTCEQARDVLTVLFSPAAKTHMPPHGGRSSWYTTLPGGWTCGPLEMGILTCWHGRVSAPTAVATFVIPGTPFPVR